MQEPKAEKGQRGQTGGRLKRNRRAKKLPQAPSEQARSKEGSPAYKMEDTKSRSPQFLWCRISNKGDQGKDSNNKDNDSNSYNDKMLTDISPEC